MLDATGLLSALRNLPAWLLGGLAAAGFAVLFVPGFGGIDPQDFLNKWGGTVWFLTITLSILSVARALDSSMQAYRAHRKAAEGQRSLRLVPRPSEGWWHLAKQQDDSLVSQISLGIEAANRSDHPVRIVKARLIWPRTKGKLQRANMMLPMAGSPYYSNKHPVPPGESVTASLDLTVRGAIARQGRPLRVTIGVTDQFGEEYILPRIVIPTHDSVLPDIPWTKRLFDLWEGIISPCAEAAELHATSSQLLEWQNKKEFEEVDLVLNEERRAYAARGRYRGELGSLNVGLASEPNFGWTEVGSVPALLWDKAQAKPVESANATLLVNLHNASDESTQDSIERYLLSHLHKASPYADVAYLIFLALHRVGRTVDAIQAARTHLSGDKVYGYSNMLGALSAIVSHEHVNIDPACLSKILEVLGEDAEQNFRLREKINLARVRQLEQRAVQP